MHAKRIFKHSDVSFELSTSAPERSRGPFQRSARSTERSKESALRCAKFLSRSLRAGERAAKSIECSKGFTKRSSRYAERSVESNERSKAGTFERADALAALKKLLHVRMRVEAGKSFLIVVMQCGGGSMTDGLLTFCRSWWLVVMRFISAAAMIRGRRLTGDLSPWESLWLN